MSPCIGQDTHAHRYIHLPTTAGRVNVTGYNVIPADHSQQLWNDKVPLNIERTGLAEWVDWSLLLIGLKLPIRWTTECNGQVSVNDFGIGNLSIYVGVRDSKSPNSIFKVYLIDLPSLPPYFKFFTA